MQYCVECAAENDIYDSACAKCGTALVLTQTRPAPAKLVEPPKPKEPRKPMAKSTKIVLGSIAAVITGLIVLGNTDFPSDVDVTVAIKAPYGGVFGDNCDLTDSALEYGANQAIIVASGTDTSAGNTVGLTYVKSANGCVATTNASVVPGQNYDIYIKDEIVGEIDQLEIESGSASEEFVLAVKHDLQGEILLEDQYQKSGCLPGEPVCFSNQNASLLVNMKKGVCNGINSYMDFKSSGTPVKFTGITSKKTVSGKLTKGEPGIDLKTGKATCSYSFEITGLVHDAKGYTVKVGRHSAPKVSINTLVQNDWIYSQVFKG